MVLILFPKRSRWRSHTSMIISSPTPAPVPAPASFNKVLNPRNRLFNQILFDVRLRWIFMWSPNESIFNSYNISCSYYQIGTHNIPHRMWVKLPSPQIALHHNYCAVAISSQKTCFWYIKWLFLNLEVVIIGWCERVVNTLKDIGCLGFLHLERYASYCFENNSF